MSDFRLQRDNACQRALNELAFCIFKESADEDYVVARIAWFEGFTRQFYWSASQAIEKYIKCSLLVNGFSAKFNHGWFEKFLEFKVKGNSSLRFLPSEFTSLANPPDLPPDITSERHESTDDFLKRISESGQTGVRYDEIGFLETGFLELRKLDVVCVWLMAICHLDAESDSCLNVREIAVLNLSKIEKSPWLKKANFALFPDLESDNYEGLMASGRQSGAQMAVYQSIAQGVDFKWIFSEFSKRSNCSKETLEKLLPANQSKQAGIRIRPPTIISP